ncbi:hypothetical protein MCUN1_001837 [Malassezia cuniculi]|uniref:GH16 domain-containing protein n=1 Tax=Malassezia cuniculi TaxID=948313 RepID=A0AAF0EVC8_9BASI|nr:hypothetical protein MCUN1_001837 [Malassezia cuniculi]
MKITGLLLVAGAALSSTAQAITWKKADTIVGNDFYNKFNFFNGKDPTNGLVNYLAKEDAVQKNLTYVKDDSFVMRVDTVEIAPSGRNSVRIQSKALYENSVYILKVKHFPTGCATWPAFWTLTWNLTNWPSGGEIDILENANDQFDYNLGSIHVDKSCKLTQNEQSGTIVYDECYAYNSENAGCRIAMNGTSTTTWGDKLNKMGGGIVAMERDFSSSGKGVRMWFWDANSNLPSDVKTIGDTVNPDNWGKPAAYFNIPNCRDSFDPHSIVFDITLCGDWAGNTYEQTSCAAQYGVCSKQVRDFGSSFNDSYWDVTGLYIFSDDGNNVGTTTIAPNATRDVTASATLSPRSADQQDGSPVMVSTTGITAVFAAVLAVLIYYAA